MATSKFEIGFRVCVVALLAVIALQLGGAAWISEHYQATRYAVKNIGVTPEGPAQRASGAPMTGMDLMVEQEAEKTIRAMSDLETLGRSASSPRR